MPNSHVNVLPCGGLCDLVTPFRDGSFDSHALAKLIQWQISCGITGIVVCGQMGEATALTREERRAVIHTAVNAAEGRVPVLAGTGTNATRSTLDFTIEAAELGASAAVIVVPYYSKPSQEGIFRHFAEVATTVDMTILVCNAPSRTAVDLAPRTFERLATLTKIAGIQDCTGDIARQALMPTELKRRFKQYSGHDLTAFPFVLSGGCGAISAAANIARRHVCAMHDALRAGDIPTAARLHDWLKPLLQVLERETGPASLKHILHLMHGSDPEVRLPLLPVEPETAAALDLAKPTVQPEGRRLAT